MKLHVDAGLPEPPYAQLRDEVRRQVTTGELAAGTRLPPVRTLASELGLAPNNREVSGSVNAPTARLST